MTTNILKAVNNIKRLGENSFNIIYPPQSGISSENRIQQVGVTLENFMKDSFCDTFTESEKNEIYSSHFSYLGNKNNPPDIIIQDSDAIEVKKIGGYRSDIQLNSSYPKSKLLADSRLLTHACRECEPGWKEKDIIYSVGVVKQNKIECLVMVYGDCYAANPEIYENVRQKVIDGLNQTKLEFAETNELGRINRVDPLGITNLRVRGMWIIQNPIKLYSNLFKIEETGNSLSIRALMREEKYNSFPRRDRRILDEDDSIEICDVKIPNPNNPANLLNSKLITCDVIPSSLR